VEYVIRAQIIPRPGVPHDPAKFRDQFRRRVRGGRCFATPYLGCREFAASFAEPDGSERPLSALDGALGPMLLDLEYARSGGRATPRFFDARLENGVLRVPPMPAAGEA
jgi:CRISPR-associated protein Cas5d